MPRGGFRPGAGKPKGSKASHTLDAMAARQNLIEMYVANSSQINAVLISLVLEGNVQAMKELFDRVYGRAQQYIETTQKKNYSLDDTEYKKLADGLVRLQKEDSNSKRV